MDYFTIADVSFWGGYTIWGTATALFLLLTAFFTALEEDEPALFGVSFLILAFAWGAVVGLPGTSGLNQEVDRLKTAEMERIGYENLTWNGDEFTGSKEGYYVVGFIKQHGDVYYVTDITRKGEMI